MTLADIIEPQSNQRGIEIAKAFTALAVVN